MSYSDKEDTTTYNVVVNHEEQYSIWPDYKEIPKGWKKAGKTGPKAECLAYIKEVWTDMRPLSLRKKMEEFSRNPPAPPAVPDSNAQRGPSLVDKLCAGNHEVEVELRPEKTLKSFKEAVDRDFIHLKFTGTQGGTELGFRLDRAASDFSVADFENGKGTAHIEGKLTLDSVKVRCTADINLQSLKGTGRLVKAEAKEAGAA
jgi:uncharacterized protein YbdZ (MbtH family)